MAEVKEISKKVIARTKAGQGLDEALAEEIDSLKIVKLKSRRKLARAVRRNLKEAINADKARD